MTAAKRGLSANTKVLIACGLGNALEWFDFVAYAMFATTIARHFFPTGDDLTSLLATLGTFAAGFLARPLGAALIGSYGDRAGRKAALTCSILLMTLGTAIIAFAPPFERIGVAAPMLIVSARLIQGISAGGEIGGAISFLVEHAPPGRRALFASWQQASVGVFCLLAGTVGYAITQGLDPDQVDSWGWRIPFMLGLSIAPVGLYIRSHLPETPAFLQQQREPRPARPVHELLTKHRGAVLTGMGLVVLWTVCSQLWNYMPTYTVVELGMPSSAAFVGYFMLGLVSLASPFVGALADRIGRRPLMIVASVGFLFLCYPAFRLLIESRSDEVFFAVQLAFAILLTLYVAPASASLAEVFPTECRSTGISLSYNIAVTVFGGFTPAISAILVASTGDKAAPAFYLGAAAAVSLAAAWSMKE